MRTVFFVVDALRPLSDTVLVTCHIIAHLGRLVKRNNTP